MALPPIDIPTAQNWSCHNCGGCCRQHLIEITEEERARIDSQGWTTSDNVKLPVYIPHGKGFRLSHQSDGACVFLDERGLCRIHAKFGESAKPLACQIYPYAFHPGGKKVALSLRFSCPSVVGNRGTSLPGKLAEIQRLAKLVVPAGAEKIGAPRIDEKTTLAWPEFFRFQRTLLGLFDANDASVSVRVLRALSWIEAIEKSEFAAVEGAGADEILATLAKSARRDVPRDLTTIEVPSGAGRAPMRLLQMQYARKDTGSHLQRIWIYRWQMLRAALRFTLGAGKIPVLQPGFNSATFAQVEEPFGALTPESEEILGRYFRVKIQGLHFCGPAYYDIPFLEGFRHLALLYAVTLWMARWLAVGEGRRTRSTGDIARALAITDHQHGYQPQFGSAGFRRRVNMLTRAGDVPRIVAWYSR